MSKPSEAARAAAYLFAQETVGPPPKKWAGWTIARIRDDVAQRVLKAIDAATADLRAENAELQKRNRRLQSTLEYLQGLRSLCEQAVDANEKGWSEVVEWVKRNSQREDEDE